MVCVPTIHLGEVRCDSKQSTWFMMQPEFSVMQWGVCRYTKQKDTRGSFFTPFVSTPGRNFPPTLCLPVVRSQHKVCVCPKWWPVLVLTMDHIKPYKKRPAGRFKPNELPHSRSSIGLLCKKRPAGRFFILFPRKTTRRAFACWLS